MMKRLIAFLIFAVGISAAQTTPNLGLQLPNYQAPNWGVALNYNFSRLDAFLSGQYILPSFSTQGLKLTNLPSAPCLSTNASGQIEAGCTATGTVSGQAAGVIPLATGTSIIGAQSHISDSGVQLTATEPFIGTSANFSGAVNATGGFTGNLTGLASQNLPIAGGTLTGPLTVPELNTVIYADQEPGTDACAKINAAIAALPANGGVVDARGFGASTQIVSTTCHTSPSDTGHVRVTVLFNPATVFEPATSSMTVLDWSPYTTVSGFSCNTTNQSAFTGNCVSLASNVTTNYGLPTVLENFSLYGDTGQGNGLYIAAPASDGISETVTENGTITGFNNGIYLNASTSSYGYINSNTFHSVYVTGSGTCINAIGLNTNAQSIDGNSFSDGFCEAGGTVGTGSATTGINGVYLRANSFSGWAVWDYNSPQNPYVLDANSTRNTFLNSAEVPLPGTSIQHNFVAGLQPSTYSQSATVTTCSDPDYSFWYDGNVGLSHPGSGMLELCGSANGINSTGGMLFGPGSAGGNTNSQPDIVATNGYDTNATPSYTWWYDSSTGLAHVGPGVLDLAAPSGLQVNGSSLSSANLSDSALILKSCGTATFTASTTSAPLACTWVTTSSHCEATWIGTNVAGGALGYTATSGSVTLTAAVSNSNSASVACSAN